MADMPATDQILDAIAECKDDDMRALLKIIHSGFSQLTAKVDSILNNEDTIKRIVLNGHFDTHHDDHVWLTANKKRLDHVAVWVETKMTVEEVNASSRRKISESVVSNILIGVLSVLGTLLVLGVANIF